MSFPSYLRYKQSNISWLGSVPDHWGVASLRHCLSEIFNGLTAEQVDAGDSTVPVTRIETISSGSIDWDRVGYVNRVEARIDRRLRHGDICFSNINSLNVIGNCAIFTDDKELYGGMNLLVLRPAPHMHPGYLYWTLRSREFRQAVESHAKPAINQASISQGALQSIGTPAPPLEEQVGIATFINRETAKIDALVEEQRRLISLLNEQVKCLVLASRSAKDTREVRLGNAADVVARPVRQNEGEVYRPLGMYNRGRGIFHKAPREKSDMGDSDFFWVKSGDLVISGQFAWEGAIGLAGEEEDGCVVSHRYPVLRAKDGVALTEYLFALLLTKHGDFMLNESSWGAAGRNRPLNLGLLLKERIWVPNMKIQMKVAEALHQGRRLAIEIDRQRDLLDERRSALISAAVTGKIKVPGLVPQPESVAA